MARTSLCPRSSKKKNSICPPVNFSPRTRAARHGYHSNQDFMAREGLNDGRKWGDGVRPVPHNMHKSAGHSVHCGTLGNEFIRQLKMEVLSTHGTRTIVECPPLVKGCDHCNDGCALSRPSLCLMRPIDSFYLDDKACDEKSLCHILSSVFPQQFWGSPIDVCGMTDVRREHMFDLR